MGHGLNIIVIILTIQDTPSNTKTGLGVPKTNWDTTRNYILVYRASGSSRKSQRGGGKCVRVCGPENFHSQLPADGLRCKKRPFYNVGPYLMLRVNKDKDLF